MARFGKPEDVTPTRDDPPMTKKKTSEPANTDLVPDNVTPIKQGGAGKKHLTKKNLGGARDFAECPPKLYVEPIGKKTRLYRASMMGACITQLAAYAMGVEPAEMPESLQPALDAGITNEPIILDLLRENGWRSITWAELEELVKLGIVAGVDPIEEQIQTRLWVGKNALVRAHPDDFMVGAEAPVWTNDGIKNLYDVEVKAFAQSTWDQWNKFGIDAFPGYKWQVATRQHSHNLPVMFAVGLKGEDGIVRELSSVIYDEPLIDLDTFTKKVKDADAIAKTKVPENLPDCDLNQWPCAYYFLPQHKGEKPKETITLDDTELGEYARARWTAAQDKKTIEKDYDDSKEKIAKWFDSHPEHRDKRVVVVDATGANRFTVEWFEVEQPESVRRAYTQRYPRVSLLKDDRE